MSKRLDKLTALIPECELLADVGCDHGYVGIAALRYKRAQKVLFVDVSAQSLAKARANCPEELRERADFICRDGLGDISADCVVIAGMGGLEIISILRDAKYLPRTLVLQPNRNAPEVREYISAFYRICYDRIVADGKFYNMIVAERADGGMELTELQRQFGSSDLLEPTDDFVLYLKCEKAKLIKILDGCNDAKVQCRLALVEQAIAAVGGIK